MLGVFRSEAFLTLLEDETASSAFRCDTDRLLCCRRHPRLRTNLNSPVPIDFQGCVLGG